MLVVACIVLIIGIILIGVLSSIAIKHAKYTYGTYGTYDHKRPARYNNKTQRIEVFDFTKNSPKTKVWRLKYGADKSLFVPLKK